MNSSEIVYDQTVPFSRKELLEKVSKSVSNKRFEHIKRVESKALELATRYNVDFQKASMAALLHDYAKERSDSEFIEYINQLKMDKILLDYGNAIWHGVVGAEIVKAELDVEDEDVLNAIRKHTVGSPYMTTLDQVLFMADYIEDGRDFEGVQKARILTEQSLEKGVAYQLRQTLAYLVENRRPVFPATIDSYNAWISKL